MDGVTGTTEGGPHIETSTDEQSPARGPYGPQQVSRQKGKLVYKIGVLEMWARIKVLS